MALISKPVQLGGLTGSVLFYEYAGDALPVHVHDEKTNHITLVSTGSFRCTGNPDIEGVVITQGMVLDWPVGRPHGFVALSDGAKMVQITKYYAK